MDNKQLLDEVFVISRIIKVEVGVIYNSRSRRLSSAFGFGCEAEADNPYRDLDHSGYHQEPITLISQKSILIIALLYIE